MPRHGLRSRSFGSFANVLLEIGPRIRIGCVRLLRVEPASLFPLARNVSARFAHALIGNCGEERVQTFEVDWLEDPRIKARICVS